MNLIDGSSVWVQSLAQTLTHVEDTEVTVLLTFPEERRVLTEPLRSSPKIEVVDPRDLGHAGPWTPRRRWRPWSGSISIAASTCCCCAGGR